MSKSNIRQQSAQKFFRARNYRRIIDAASAQAAITEVVGVHSPRGLALARRPLFVAHRRRHC